MHPPRRCATERSDRLSVGVHRSNTAPSPRADLPLGSVSSRKPHFRVPGKMRLSVCKRPITYGVRQSSSKKKCGATPREIRHDASAQRQTNFQKGTLSSVTIRKMSRPVSGNGIRPGSNRRDSSCTGSAVGGFDHRQDSAWGRQTHHECPFEITPQVFPMKMKKRALASGNAKIQAFDFALRSGSICQFVVPPSGGTTSDHSPRPGPSAIHGTHERKRFSVFHVEPGQVNLTIAAALRHWFPGKSWSDVRRLLSSRHVTVSGNLCLDKGRRLKEQEVVKILASGGSAPRRKKTSAFGILIPIWSSSKNRRG